MDELGAAAHGVEGEAAGVAEHVEDFPSLRIAFEQTAVVPLVNEEARLLSSEPIDVELQTVLHRHVVGVASEQETVLLSEFCLVGKGGLRLIEDVLERIAHHCLECLGDDVPVEVHANGVCLHHSSVAIDVNHQSRQVVALTMHETIGVVVLTRHTDAVSHILGDGEFLLVKVLVNLLIVEGQHPDHDAANLEMSSGDVFIFAGEDHHFLAFLGLFAHALDGSGENPGMETSQ